jgi:ABC-2 type transport system ATP-binding protein
LKAERHLVSVPSIVQSLSLDERACNTILKIVLLFFLPARRVQQASRPGSSSSLWKVRAPIEAMTTRAQPRPPRYNAAPHVTASISPSIPPPLAISCRGLVKHYGDVEAVRGLDLDVRSGECFGLLGPNGAGKTTTIEILEGILEPTAGEVTVLGSRWNRDGPALRERIGLTLQDTRLPDKLTVHELVALIRSFYRRGRDVDDLIARVSLTEKTKARYEHLSGGQKQRLAVACALVGEPELVFLDEPTTGLDPQSRRNLWDLVLELRHQGKTVMLTTHYMDEAERLCDRVGIVDHGKLMSLGTPRELIASLGGEEVIELALEPAGALAATDLLALPGVRTVRPEGEGFVLTVAELHVSLPALIARVEAGAARLAALRTHRATLEDVFVHLTGRQLRE